MRGCPTRRGPTKPLRTACLKSQRTASRQASARSLIPQDSNPSMQQVRRRPDSERCCSSSNSAVLAASLSTVCLSAVLLAPAGVGSRRARHAARGGADDAEDVFVELAGEAGFEWSTSYVRGRGAMTVLAVADALAP